jgi:prolyl-tRNA editing enzyme YbaK/EbsC (Cys-tRNA(Pro) deacylase)
MSLEKARSHMAQWHREQDIIEAAQSTATVAEAAAALGVAPARIAKTISLTTAGGAMLVVAAGDVKLDNRKYKDRLGFTPRMRQPDEALMLTGHAVGGVCPFGLPEGVDVYLDTSLQRFETVFPACGSSNSCIEVTLEDLAAYSGSHGWADVCTAVAP